MLTVNIEKAAKVLRYPNISVTIPDINWEAYYSKETIRRITQIIFIFQ